MNSHVSGLPMSKQLLIKWMSLKSNFPVDTRVYRLYCLATQTIFNFEVVNLIGLMILTRCWRKSVQRVHRRHRFWTTPRRIRWRRTGYRVVCGYGPPSMSKADPSTGKKLIGTVASFNVITIESCRAFNFFQLWRSNISSASDSGLQTLHSAVERFL